MLLKLALSVALIAALLFGFRVWGRLEEARNRKRAEDASPRRLREASETLECPICKAFIPVDSLRNCGREGCPY